MSGITKEDSNWLLFILVQCANIAISYYPHLESLYLRLRRKDHTIAIVVTARKMSMFVYYLLRKEEWYSLN